MRVRNIGLVAQFDLLESLRSRKAIALISLYLAGALGASALFVRLLHTLQERLAEEFGEAIDMQTLMESPAMARVVSELAGDPEVAKAIVAVPPMALFYGWLATNFVPLLVLFTSADAISGDVASGGVRFSLFRADRMSWALGKLLGQTCLMLLGVLVGALGCWAVGAIWLDNMPIGNTAWWLLRIAGRTGVYSFAYLGVALCASQLVRTNARAIGLALLMMFACSLLGGITQLEPVRNSSPGLFGALSKLFPNGHSLALWHPGWFESGTALFGLVAIGMAFFGLGYWRFSNRDS
jgi:ABC-type transport system involved in multi-copper enzyme maturation permease subunit